MADQTDNVVEGVIEEDGATVLLNLESLIREHVGRIDNGKAELKKLREMIQSVLTNDETYRNHEEASKKAAKVKSATKAQLFKLPANDALVKKVQALAAEVKETDEALSDYLREYQRLSGSNEFETSDGDVREIIYVAKLVKKAKRSR